MNGRTKTHKNEYGRFHLMIDDTTNTARLVIENVNRKGEHWLTLSPRPKSREIIGYLRLRPYNLNPDSTCFEVCEVRPATGPLLHPQGATPGSEAPAREETE